MLSNEMNYLLGEAHAYLLGMLLLGCAGYALPNTGDLFVKWAGNLSFIFLFPSIYTIYVWWKEPESNKETKMDFIKKAGTVVVSALVANGSMMYATHGIKNPPIPPLPIWLFCLIFGFAICAILYDLYYWNEDDNK